MEEEEDRAQRRSLRFFLPIRKEEEGCGTLPHQLAISARARPFQLNAWAFFLFPAFQN